MSSKKVYIDLFAGCGGMSLGLYNSGKWEGLFAIEKDPMAFETLKHNLIDKVDHFRWPEWLKRRHYSITTILNNYRDELESLQGQVDLVVGGPPCQGFSNAGRRKEDDKRNDLIKDYVRFVKLVRPKVIFFENVKGFTQEFQKNKSKGKKYSNYVLKRLNALGYDVKGKMIDFSKFGVPQKRTRFILVGVDKKLNKSSKKFFSQIEANVDSFLASKDLSVPVKLEDAISDLLMEHGTEQSPDTKSFQAGVYDKPNSDYQRLLRKSKRLKGKVADSHRFVNHRSSTVERFKVILSKAEKGKDLDEDIRKQYSIKKHTIIPLDKDDVSPTLTTLPDDYIHYSEPRVLTVREYARVQSFDDWYEIKGKYTTGGKRRTKEVPRYSQIGNAIPPLFAEQAANSLAKLI
ncbi:DNA cytosine methyltransferase [Gracilimonas sediminicola]|uniref:Cytosine-specific methyltransferase n=1 Tax=Gracilimonas sediminicola TaxID=2952158 RepID=A0A9X2L4L7_9BACT|nr:DNA cytosine methyltransferase [Gracilimonas sediminicola]MCP9291633.1 DNA cytosine methyltransferase [Gracilimonas sediminicola]